MQTTKRMSRVTGLCLLCVMTIPAGLFAQAAAAPAGAKAALLDTIPDDAAGFIAIRDLKELDADIQAVSAQIGFPLGADGMFPAPLEWLKASLQMTEGLREEGGAALVLLNGREIKSVDEIPDKLVLYVPATDPKALLTSMGGEEGTDGVYKIDLAGSPSVAVAREGFVILAKAPEGATEGAPAALTAAAKSKGDGIAKVMAPDRVKAYSTQDLFVWVNFRALSPEVRKEITEGLQEMFAGLGAMAGGGGAPQGAEAVQQIDKFLTEGEEVSLGVSLNAKVGLGFSAYSRVKPDSDIAKLVAATPVPKDSLLIGLPDEDFILAGGAVVGTTPQSLEQMRKTAEGVAAQIASMDTDEGTPLTPENLKPIIDAWMDMLKNTRRAGMSISKLGSAESDAGLIGLTVVAEVQDAKAWRAQVRQSFDKIKQIAIGVAKADGVEQEQIDQMAGAFVWQENAGEVAGASVDILRVELDKIEAAPPEAVASIKGVVGPEGILVRLAAVGDDHVVVAFGGGEERLAKVVGLVKEKQAPLAAAAKVAVVSKRMPGESKVAELYFSLDNLLQTVDAVTTKLGTPLPVKLSLRDAAPIGITTINVDKTSQQVDILIPSELIVSGAQMVRQQLLPMLMMGGMGGGQQSMEAPEEDDDNNADKDSDTDEPASAAPKPREE